MKYFFLFLFFVVRCSFAGTWGSNVLPVAKGTIKTSDTGEKIQLRYPGWSQTDYSSYPTHSNKSSNALSLKPMLGIMPDGIIGDAKKGGTIWQNHSCVNCHALPSDSRWGGNMGPNLIAYGKKKVDPKITYQLIFDPRYIYPNTLMPAWGAIGILNREEIVHLVAYLNTLSGDNKQWSDLQKNPYIRNIPKKYLGDNLDEIRNPAVVFAELSLEKWLEAGSTGKSCSTCHGEDPYESMKGVATSYPKYVDTYDRVVSIEDLLSVHGHTTTGHKLSAGSDENVNMAMLIKSASNGMKINIDLKNKKNKKAWERGKGIFYKRIGQRNHACSDCHTTEHVKGRWLGGRYISNADAHYGITYDWPAFRTSFGESWSIRKRFQWCMLPHGANNLSIDSVEYADLELYMTSFDNGKVLSVPGLKD